MSIKLKIKQKFGPVLFQINSAIKTKERNRKNKVIFNRFSEFTMIPKQFYLGNLELAYKVKGINGAIVECGVWRGGMIAGAASILGKERDYYLFDSFEGLPKASEIDGVDANNWQLDTKSEGYFNNCKAEIEFANKAMSMVNLNENNIHIIKGWFNESLANGNYNFPIAMLRLDGDWYESTITCLQYLFSNVVPGGLIIIDDYYTWEGCAKAVHDYLSKNGRPERIYQYNNSIAYLIKSA
jgi:O-methyltransferase